MGLIKAFKESVNVEVVAHLTLVGKSKQELNFIVDEFSSMGVTKIVALRGDVAEGSFIAHQDGFQNMQRRYRRHTMKKVFKGKLN